jgi:cell division protease FtsH
MNMSDKKTGKKQKKTSSTNFFQQIISTILILVAVGILYSSFGSETKKSSEITLSQVAEMVTAGQVSNILVKGDTLTVTAKDESKKIAKKESGSSLAETLATYGVSGETLRNTPITVKADNNALIIILNVLSILAPILFIGFFFWMMSRQMNGQGGMKAFSFGQSKARVTDPNSKDKKITFADVAGNEEAKLELLDIVDFLKQPKKYFDVGAKMPKGVLLTGNPGTGKTLLARAVAGEAGVPFFHLSGSEFVEMFVGVGASRVRDLFEQAKLASPAIIFIDEIDAVGRARGVGFGGGNDEREQTLNQILVEMDGFEPTSKLVVMAATNRADVLDPALLRPGRFDRRVYLTLPDRKDREAILNIHANEKPLADDIKLETVAARTPGFSGADLQSVMNEGAIFAARDNRVKIVQTDLLSAIEKVMIGPERKSHLHTPDERKLIAYHEAGHAILASVLPHADPVHKVTIIPRGSAGGYTLHIPLEDRKLMKSAQYLDDITVTLGGYAIEKIVYGDVTTGPSNDLQVVTRTARDMVTKWGMSDLLGPVAYNKSEGMIPGSGQGTENRDYSGHLAQKIDEEVTKIVHNALQIANDTLNKYRDALEAVVLKLLEVETLEQDEYNTIIKQFGIEPKKLPKSKTV